MTEEHDYAVRCKQYMEKHHVAAEQLAFAESVHTAADAIRLMGASFPVVKTVVLAVGTTDLRFIACLVRGEHKVDLAKVRALMGTGAVRIATRDEVLAQTGYPAGGVPPFGHGLTVYIDEDALALDTIIAGGGSDRTLVKTTMKEIAKTTRGIVERIALR